MSFEIRTIENFDRQAKRLAKHYASFRDDFKTLLEELQEKPMAGTDLGGGIRKVRMAISSKGKEKKFPLTTMNNDIGSVSYHPCPTTFTLSFR